MVPPKGGRTMLDHSTRHVPYSVAYQRVQGHSWCQFRTRATTLHNLVLLTVLAVAAATGAHVLQAWHRASSVQYVLVIDSGSSGTRIYAYNWTAPVSKGGLPVVRGIPPSAAAHLVPKDGRKGMYNRVETRPGLDAFVANASALSGALEPLLAWAQAVVPARHQASTPVFLLCTGGLRRLQPRKQAVLLADIRNLLSKSGFRFHPSWARVISGDDEGAYGWLALNYEQARLQQHPAEAEAAAAASTKKSSSTAVDTAAAAMERTITSLGALDLGGSSLQITFEVQPPSSSSSSSSQEQLTNEQPPVHNISVSGHTYYLHIHSFKQYGLNEAFDRSVTLLLAKQQHQQGASGHALPASYSSSSNSGADALKQQQQKQHSNVSTAADTQQQQLQDLDNLQRVHHTSESSESSLQPRSSSGSSTPAARAQAVMQHDLAVAGVAGVQPAHKAPEGGQQQSATHEHQLQADLAIAAAAGLHPHTTGIQPVTSSRNSAGSSSDNNLESGAAADSGDDPDIPLPTGSKHEESTGINPATAFDAAGHARRLSSTGNTDVAGSDASGVALDGLRQRLSWSGSAVSASRQALHSRSSINGSSSNSASSNGRWVPWMQHAQHRLQAGLAAATAAGGTRCFRQQRHLLLQQQLHWLEPVGKAHNNLPAATVPAANASSSNSSSHGGSSSSSSHSWSLAAGVMHEQERMSHDARWRQLLREVLLRDTPAPKSETSSPKSDHVSQGPTVGAPHPVVPIEAGSSGSSGSSSSTGSGTGTAASTASHSSSSRVREEQLQQQSSGGPAAPVISNMNSSAGVAVVEHPCLHEGFEGSYDRIAYDGVMPLPDKVLLHGQPDWEACMKLVDDVVNASAPCVTSDRTPACVLGTPQPELQGSFMALTGFYVVSRFLDVHDARPLEPLLTASKTLCGRSWSWVQQQLGAHINVERYCTWGPYVVKLLLRGLGLEEQQVMIAQDGGLGWPLGAALVEASKLPAFSHNKHAKAAAAARRGRSGRQRGTGPVDPPTSLRGTGKIIAAPADGSSAGPATWQAAAGSSSSEVAAKEDGAAEQRSQDSTPAVIGAAANNRGPAKSRHRSWPWAQLPVQRAMSLKYVAWALVIVTVWLSAAVWCWGLGLGRFSGAAALLPSSMIGSGGYGPGKAAHASNYPMRARLTPNRSSFAKL